MRHSLPYIWNKILLNSNAEFLLIFFISCFYILGINSFTNLMFPGHPDFGQIWDHHQYIAIADHNAFNYNIAPYCWRIFLPFLVKILSFDKEISFLSISILSTIGTMILTYYIGKIIFPQKKILIPWLFAFSNFGWLLKFLIIDFWLVDAFVIFQISLAFYLLIKSKYIYLSLILITGVLTKESMLFVIPVIYIYLANSLYDKSAVNKTVFISFMSIIAFILIRLIVPALNNSQSYTSTLPSILTGLNYRFPAEPFSISRFTENLFPNYYYLTIGSFGVLPFMAIFYKKSASAKYAKLVCLILFLAYVQLLFASDIQRLLMIAAPFCVLLYIQFRQDYLMKMKSYAVMEIFLLIVNFVIMIQNQNIYATMKYINLSTLLILSIYFIMIYIRHSSNDNFSLR